MKSKNEKRYEEIHLDAITLDCSALNAVAEILKPHLKYDPNSEYRVLNKETSTEKYKELYDSVFLPWCIERKAHFQVHHNFHIPEFWHGEQACLSMIHALNLKAWWLLYFFTIKEALERHCRITGSETEIIARSITGRIIDDGESVAKAIASHVDKSYVAKHGYEKNLQEQIIADIEQQVENYKKADSYSYMMYR